VERNNGCSSDSALRYHPYALLTPRIRQPGLAFPHPLWRGRPTPLGSTSCPRGGPRLEPPIPLSSLILHLCHRIFCWAFHSGQTLNRWPRVCVLQENDEH